MQTRVQKWGNSLAVRIPKSFAMEAGLHEDGPVELSIVDGRLIIRPVTVPNLDQLLQGITEDNLHGEWSTGPAVGGETW